MAPTRRLSGERPFDRVRASSRPTRGPKAALSPLRVRVVGVLAVTLCALPACGVLDDDQKAQAKQAGEQAKKQAEEKLREAQVRLDEAAKQAKETIDERRPEVEQKLGELRDDAKGRVERAKANLDEATSYEPIDGASEAVSCSAQVCSVDRAFAAQFAAHPEWLAREVKIAPAFRGGRIYGLRIAYVHDGSLVDLLGLRAGDVVTTVDGRPITSVAELQKLSQRDRSEVRDIEVRYERGGHARTLTLKQAR